MAKEIEHKYLVKKDLWKKTTPERSFQIKQAYLSPDPEKIVRLRTKGEKGFLTIKGKNQGSSRDEYEYEIPVNDAAEMIQKFCTQVIEKTRHEVSFKGKVWEVDEFGGDNDGLIVAEIELTSEDEKYELPEWVSENVTGDARYTNSNLSTQPFKSWKS